MTTAAMSKGFFEFVKSIGEAKSKQEEDRIIENELHVLKAKMAGRNVGKYCYVCFLQFWKQIIQEKKQI